MKHCLQRILAILVKLATALAACIGCSPKSQPGEDPDTIHWRGQDSGNDGTTVVRSRDCAEPVDQP